tara:strand:+ start:218 stop:727 length:510 start_codon:yes stop_codon:yes gene_type:complete
MVKTVMDMSETDLTACIKTAVEDSNASLKEENAALKAEVRRLRNNLPPSPLALLHNNRNLLAQRNVLLDWLIEENGGEVWEGDGNPFETGELPRMFTLMRHDPSDTERLIQRAGYKSAPLAQDWYIASSNHTALGEEFRSMRMFEKPAQQPTVLNGKTGQYVLSKSMRG